jgi:MFS family permease
MGSFDSLRNPSYRRRLWIGAVLSNTGTWMQTTAVAWHVLELTHSAFWVSFVSFAGTFPIVLAPLGGVFADRLNRRRILLAAQAGMMTAALLLTILTAAGQATLAVVLTLTLAQGLGFGLSGPTWMAFIPSLVPPQDMVNAVALNSAQFNLARVIGPAVAGGLIPIVGVGPIFAVNTASFLAVLLAIWRIPMAAAPPRSGRSLLAELRGGFAYVRRSPIIRSLVAAIAVVSFFAGPAQAILPVFASEVYGLGAGAYGALGAALGLGSVVGALAVGRGGNRVGRRGVATSMVALGTLLVGFAVAPAFAAGLALLAGVGCAYLYMIAASNGRIQVEVDEAMRGRVMSLSMLAFGAPFPIGSLMAGLLVDRVGPTATVAGGASVCVAWGLGMLARRARAAQAEVADAV